MLELIEANWPLFVIALLIGAIVGYLAFRPRQRVTLSENTPVRPHMSAVTAPVREGRGLTDEAAAAASDVAGPIIGTVMVLLLLAGNRQLGVSSNFRHICAAVAPGKAPFLRYNWREVGGWNLAFALGILIGARGFRAIATATQLTAISAATQADLAQLGIRDFSGLAPAQVFSWDALLTPTGLICIVLGGFLVGFGARWAGGCTSGHGITGLATLQPASFLAVAGFFAGGLFVTWVVLPWLL